MYAHWSGTSMAGAAMAVLENGAFRARVRDASYAARIGIQTALEYLGAEADHETGFGLWLSEDGPCDNDYRRIITIDVMTGKVYVEPSQHVGFCADKNEIKDPTEQKLLKAMEA